MLIIREDVRLNSQVFSYLICKRELYNHGESGIPILAETTVIRAILWKEFREQGLIALTLILLGSGVLAGAAQLTDPAVEGASPNDIIHYLGMGRLATLMLGVTAGMVCGGAVFAAERETGTMAFLVSLPSTYRRIWRAKFLAGLALTAIQIGMLLGAATLLGLVPTLGWA